MPKILVTGGAGYSGILTCCLLLKGTKLWYVDVLLPRRIKNLLVKPRMRMKGIELRLFHIPLHKQPPCKTNDSFPNAEDYPSSGLWLPPSSFLKDNDTEHICTEFQDVLN